MNFNIQTFLCRPDNIGIIIHDNKSKLTATIDTPNANEILKVLNYHGWSLTHIFITHHHADHTKGNIELKNHFNCKIFASCKEKHKIPGVDHVLSEGEIIHFGDHKVEVMFTPGHTTGHICYHFVKEKLLFVGDVLFRLGCGRLLEGTPEEMFSSLQKIASLPEETRIYFGHEYTQSNARFALSIDCDNEELKIHAAEIETLRKKNALTIPTTLSLEKKTNPFLRTSDPEIRKKLNMEDKSDQEIFITLRNLKDIF
ncbi:Hydroxyacylglutathione hydrolase [Liberibacter crescens BT-1]|uniref:Hydroxyacylglutathione hydrolase n=2 Tax=Liberibacter crescens TaxID=1273132 RepID=L0EU99_LIBCB|nr:hydroxyacylglutathione hydrolase [Liberibacter crescens]AGA65119.1 Hydroxyacylglutathione hydrolase [Liberibacter crescens BT-1]AMC13092.1 hydroxyacylglutathione hydrolase [Liberibacter crescens]